MGSTIFFTLVRSKAELRSAKILIDSLRTFGGVLSQSPFWVFEADPKNASCAELIQAGAQVIDLQTPASLCNYYFASKVSACAQAETLAAEETGSLVWLNASCLIIQPPLGFELGDSFDLAVRPVHIRNIGQPVDSHLDVFWQRVYAEVELQDHSWTVESFVDGQELQAYFNSHLLSVRPSLSLFRRWRTHFEALVLDQEFQSGACQDELHKIFLHQAILSALIAVSIDPQRTRLLPPGYSYPYHLHQEVPQQRRAHSLNELVCLALEDEILDPDNIDDIEIHEPLRSWLADQVVLKLTPG